MAGSAQAGTFDPFSFAVKRCVAPAAIGRDVDTSGMQRVPAAYRADWESGFASAKAYAFPVGSLSSLPVPNPVLVVPRDKNAPICRLTHKGLGSGELRKLARTFAKRPIVKEDVDLKTSADGVQTRGFVVTENARSYVLLVVSVPSLKSNSVEVFTSRAFAGLGES